MTKLQRLLSHLKQPSTISGVIAIASLFGMALTEDKVSGIFAVIIMVVELWSVLRNERKK